MIKRTMSNSNYTDYRSTCYCYKKHQNSIASYCGFRPPLVFSKFFFSIPEVLEFTAAYQNNTAESCNDFIPWATAMVTFAVAGATPFFTADSAAATIAVTTGAIAGAASGLKTMAETGRLGGRMATLATVMNGLIGNVVLGANECLLELSTGEHCLAYRWDCWRALVHDDNRSQSRSLGRRLLDVLSDVRIRRLVIDNRPGRMSDADQDMVPHFWPRFFVENIWNEIFYVDYVQLHGIGLTAAHAVQLDCRIATRIFSLKAVRLSKQTFSEDLHSNAQKRKQSLGPTRPKVKGCWSNRRGAPTDTASLQPVLH